jgi:hypothetical protein
VPLAGEVAMFLTRLFIKLLIILFAGIFLIQVENADAATLGKRVDTGDLVAAVANSDMIFTGRVTSVQFRLSDGDPGAYTVVPLTYVTYSVDQVLRGEWTGDTLTLRFLGGATGVDGRIMHMPHQPIFKVGDADIVYVANNGRSACPLVNCSAGRFRVIAGKVFSNNGFPVTSLADQRVSLGLLPVGGNHLSMVIPAAPSSYIQELRDRLAKSDYQQPSDERARLEKLIFDISAPRTFTMRFSGMTISAAASVAVPDSRFFEVLTSIASKSPPPDTPVQSAPFDQQVLFPPPQKGSLRVSPPARTKPLTDEQRLLEQNDGNPVIPRD